jgi:hypothetical protein
VLTGVEITAMLEDRPNGGGKAATFKSYFEKRAVCSM